MNFKIHRGAHEIGGSCVEVWTDTTKILIDFGMPLVQEDGKEFDFKKYKGFSTDKLIQNGVLPDIKGIYNQSGDLIDGIIISHAHQDHYGLLNYVNSKVAHFMGEATHRIIEINKIFTPQNIHIENVSYFVKEKTFQIGDISITPYWVDHSAFDSYAFLVEANGKRIFYSGDFRNHGRKANVFKWFTHNAPQNVDYLLLEGTNIGQEKKPIKSEIEIEEDFIEVFKQKNKINLVYTSGQNIDRLVSIYRACLKTRKTLVVDVYVAQILKKLSQFASIPYPSDKYANLKVIFPYFTSRRLKKTGNVEILYQFKKYKITKTEIKNSAENIVVIVRPSMKKDFEKIEGIEGGNFIYSMWSGYLEKPETKEFIEYFEGREFEYHKIHTSGHTGIDALKQLVDAIKPKYIVPIHTFKGSEYHNIFNYPVLELADKIAKFV